MDNATGVNTFWTADYSKIEERVCALCALGNTPKFVIAMSGVERVQTRFPRSKKKRIRKKWSKQERNFTVRPIMVIDTESSPLHVFRKPPKLDIGAKLQTSVYG